MDNNNLFSNNNAKKRTRPSSAAKQISPRPPLTLLLLQIFAHGMSQPAHLKSYTSKFRRSCGRCQVRWGRNRGIWNGRLLEVKDEFGEWMDWLWLEQRRRKRESICNVGLPFSWNPFTVDLLESMNKAINSKRSWWVDGGCWFLAWKMT